MTCLKYQYTGPKRKLFKRIEVGNLSLKEIREMVSDVVNDDDRLFFAKDGVTPDEGFKELLNDSHVKELANIAKTAMTGVCKIHVFHSWSKADPPNVEGEDENNVQDAVNLDETQEGERLESVAEMLESVYCRDAENEGEKRTEKVNKCTARKRILKGKEKIIDEVCDDENGDETWYKSGEESTEDSLDDMSDLRENYSDEEFADMRKIRDDIRRENEKVERDQSQFIKDSLVGFKNTDERELNDGEFVERENNSISSGSIYGIGSQEESDVDSEFAYAEPSSVDKKKGK